MSDQNKVKPTAPAVQTTGHAWDGDLQEYNNPLPRWWLWSFYGTVVFAVLYWFMFPAWPVGDGWTRGVTTASVIEQGQTVDRPWNTRYQLIAEMQTGDAALRQRAYAEQISSASFQEILDNPEMMAFARSVGRGLFGDNCAACHGSGGQGVVGLFPNLADDAWLWGGTPERIHETLIQGRNGYMPAFGGVLNPSQLTDVSEYVLSLSGLTQPGEAVEPGREIFQGPIGGCYTCHTPEGTGLQSLGSANLTDAIWTLVDLPAEASTEAKRDALSAFIAKGVQGNRVMPGWSDRLSPTDLKLLAVYTHQLGGGQ